MPWLEEKTIKKIVPKTAYLVALKSCQLRGFYVFETQQRKTQNAPFSLFDLFTFGFFVSTKTHE